MPRNARVVTTNQGDLDRDFVASRIVEMRDAGSTLQTCADHFGLRTRQIARSLWVRGLQNAGRGSEINSRRLEVEVGGVRISIDSNDLSDTATFAPHILWTTFGVEIECYSLGMDGCMRTMRSAGFDCEVEQYNHRTRDHWKVVGDASISGGRGAEVVSPVLRGDDGLRHMRTAMTALREGGARVNSSCGGHVHIGMDGWMSRNQMAIIIERWALINRALEMLILPSRRSAYYNRRLRIDEARHLARDFESGRVIEGNRYLDLNIHAFARYGTFEVRMHNGSLNGKNHSAWVALLQATFKFLASASLESVMEIMQFTDGEQRLIAEDEMSDSQSAFIDQRITNLSEDEKRDAMRRLISALLNRGLLTERTATMLSARLAWIARNSNNHRGA